jgi:hypothetical protein
MRWMPVLLLAIVPACTLDLADDSPPDVPPDVPPDPMTTATRVIGTDPHVSAEAEDWASVWINYPSVDCTRVERYGADIAVKIDTAYDQMLAETGLVPGSSQPFVSGWLALEREDADHLWRVTGWVPDSEPQPECYVW